MCRTHWRRSPSALGYAVEIGPLPANPLGRVQRKAPAVAKTVDRHVMASPAQGEALLRVVRAQGRCGRRGPVRPGSYEPGPG